MSIYVYLYTYIYIYICKYIYIYIYILEWARTYPCAELAALSFIVLTVAGSMQLLFTGFVSVSVCCNRFRLVANGSELLESSFDLATEPDPRSDPTPEPVRDSELDSIWVRAREMDSSWGAAF